MRKKDCWRKLLVQYECQVVQNSSLLRRGSKGFFFSGGDPLSNVSAGTGLPATAESAGASARYHAQDGRGNFLRATRRGGLCTLCQFMACKILR